MTTFGWIVLVVAAVFFAGMGVYALVTPARLVAPFDVTLGSATARSEVRAVYGGFGLAIAAILVVAIADAQLRAGIVTTVAAALAGMAFGRAVSALDARTSFYPNWFYFLVEAVAAAGLFWVAAVTA
ncbi:DUF4345 domain-containing protein [Mycolicibacterium duvalii]|uniref:Membrane protein n=2 Tax=Mycolicibacterium duvalii TaxID=39688 RepID=A0A7I7K2U0_9MYCO|nr:DUF4345 domain-containing protein [Mycolicibacterium duvalii]MCV7366590.1 DUF4345 domain-containing protein [Mycolicibacterium duvalii]PEG41620.1 DUF4345 domain-containing protein [Mycolicibacterium duvalii]BBX17799.1 membrane protein [Mycolicibacterium duvalii]